MQAAFLAGIPPVDQAAEWAHELVMRETRGPGDLDNAMRRIGRKTGVGYQALRNLRYRKPKDIPASVFFKLGQAYHDFIQSQIRKLADELETTRAIAGADNHFVAKAGAVVNAADSAASASGRAVR